MSKFILQKLTKSMAARLHIYKDIYKGVDADIHWIKLILAFSFLIPLVITRQFFFGDRFYALTPVFAWMPALPLWLEHIAFILMVLFLLGIATLPNATRCIWSFLILAFLFSLWDQSRWMPYYYQFFFMFLALGCYTWQTPNSTRKQLIFHTLRIILISIYFWSGFHKINLRYIELGYPWMMSAFADYQSTDATAYLNRFAIFTPFIELSSGLGLLFRKTRRVAVVSITLMHLVILLIFGPLGLDWNNSVWSWNVGMIIFNWILFWNCSSSYAEILTARSEQREPILSKRKIIHKLTILCFSLMPILNFWGLWDDFLSHALYCWTTREAEIEVTQDIIPKLPPETQPFVRTHQGSTFISIFDWSYALFKSPPYHSYRVFKAIFAKICNYTGNPSEITLKIYEKPNWRTGHSPIVRFQCQDV